MTTQFQHLIRPDESELLIKRIAFADPKLCDEMQYGMALARIAKLMAPFGDEYSFIFAFNGLTWDGVVVRSLYSIDLRERDLLTILAFIALTIEKNATRPF